VPSSARDDAALAFSILTASVSLATIVYGVELLKQGACDRRRAHRLQLEGTSSGSDLSASVVMLRF